MTMACSALLVRARKRHISPFSRGRVRRASPTGASCLPGCGGVVDPRDEKSSGRRLPTSVEEKKHTHNTYAHTPMHRGSSYLQSATTIRELWSSSLNCSGDWISTVLDILAVGGKLWKEGCLAMM
jgi:hypothetical protein